MKKQQIFLLLCLFLFISAQVYAQNTYYSTGNGNFTAPATWNTNADGTSGSAPSAGHQIAGNNTYIVQDGHTVTVDGNIDVDILVVGSGSSGQLTIGSSTTALSLTINGNLVVRDGATLDVANFTAVHTVTLGRDINNTGTIDFYRDTDSYADVTMQGSLSTSYAGTTNRSGQNQFHNLTLSGDNGRQISIDIDVVGDFNITGSGTAVNTDQDIWIDGDFSVVAGNSFTATGGDVTFEGTAAQTINAAHATFHQISLNNGGSTNPKTINGDLVVNNLLHIFNDAWLVSTTNPHSHTIARIQGDNTNQAAYNFANGTISLTGAGGDDLYVNGADGTLYLGDDEIFIDGNVSIQDGDQVVVNNNVTVRSGYLVVDGNGTAPEATFVSAAATAGTHTFLLNSGTTLYVRGSNNFPTTFAPDFQDGSTVRFDEGIDQTIPLRNDAGTAYIFSNFYLRGGSTTKTLSGNPADELTINGEFRVDNNNVILNAGGRNVNLSGDLINGSGDFAFTNTNILTLNGTDNDQRIDPPVNVAQVVINKPGLTDIRRVDFRGDITVSSGLTATNPAGSDNRLLDIEMNENRITGSGPLVLNDFVRIRTDRNTSFYIGLTPSFDINSYVLFERNADGQQIPFANYGHVQINRGDKVVAADIIIHNDFTSLGWNVQLADAARTIELRGDLNNIFMAGTAGPEFLINGSGNQTIIGSGFSDISFSNAGTKTISRNTEIYGDVSIQDVTVNAQSFLLTVGGNWTEASGTFTQQADGETRFNGGGTQTVTTQAGSAFGRVLLQNGTTLQLGSNIQTGRFDTGNDEVTTLDLTGYTLSVTGDFIFRRTTNSLIFDAASSIALNGAGDQDIYDQETGTPTDFPALSFSGSGLKRIISSNPDVNVEGDFSIASGLTVDARNEDLIIAGDWNNNGSFQHTASVTFDNGAQSISGSSFHHLYIGDGTDTGTKTIGGNINLSGSLEIRANATLDAGTGSHTLTVTDHWTNRGIFVPHTGTVTFAGGNSNIRTATGTADAEKVFYNLVVNILPNNRLQFVTGDILNDLVTVQNDLTIESGILRLNSSNNTDPAIDLQVGGDFLNQGGDIEYNRNANRPNTIITFNNGSSESLQLQTGGATLRSLVFNAPGATYTLQDDLVMDNGDFSLTLQDASLALNGQLLQTAGGGAGGDTTPSLVQNGGTITVNEGAVLSVGGNGADPDYDKNGGTLTLQGTAANPATLTAPAGESFSMEQSLGSFVADNYVVSSTEGSGISLIGGNIANGGTNFGNGSFNNGTGTAYLTLGDYAFGIINADAVAFNDGPTHNVSATNSAPASNYITFTINGGGLSGEAFEQDSPDGSATTGAIRWTLPPGISWEGDVSSDWHTADNWSSGAVPTATDIVYINSATLSGGSAIVQINNTDATCAEIYIQGGGMTLDMNGTGNLSIAENLTVQASNSFNAANTVTVGENWNTAAGTFTAGTSNIVFDNATTGTFAINSDDDFNDITLPATNTATFRLGSNLTAGSITIRGGVLDAVNNNITLSGDWLVSGGTFEAGSGRVEFNAGTGVTQLIAGGTFFDIELDGASTKQVDANFAVSRDLRIRNVAGNTFDLTSNTIFVGDDWITEGSAGTTDATFIGGTGTVIFNGDGGGRQDITSMGESFHRVIFQGGRTKRIDDAMSLTGAFSVINNCRVEVRGEVSGDGGDAFSMTTGQLDVYTTNFPASFSSYNLTGGYVIYRGDLASQNIAALNYDRVQIRWDETGSAPTKTLQGNITVADDLILRNALTLDVAGHTITLGDNFDVTADQTINWNNGTLIHNGGGWNMDPDLSSFHHLILEGTGGKNMQSDLTLSGDLTVRSGVVLDMRTYQMNNTTGTGTSMTVEQNGEVESERAATDGPAYPTNFATYDLDPGSLLELRGIDQTLYTNGGTIDYGNINVYATGTVTLDGNLSADGDFIMNDNPTLADGGFNMTLSGSRVYLNDYTPSANTISLTFDRNGDQEIRENENSGAVNLDLPLVNFNGSGEKLLSTRNGGSRIIITGDVNIQSGVTFYPIRSLEFSGASFSNLGTILHNDGNDDFIFTGGTAQSVDLGVDHLLTTVTFSNTAGTTLINNGINVNTGLFTVSAGATADFAALDHNIASVDFVIDGTWDLADANVDFNRNNTQNIPAITANHITVSGGGRKEMLGAWDVQNLTIEAGVVLDVNDGTTSYPLTVRGNWLNNGGDFVPADGTVSFESDGSTPTTTIATAGEPFENITFNQATTTARTYQLNETLAIHGDLTIGNGATVDLNGQTMLLGNNDGGDPASELFRVQSGATLEVDAGAVLSIETRDNNGGADPPLLDIQSGGTLRIVGASDNVATLTRQDNNDRYGVNIASGATIAAQYYQIEYLDSNGLVVNSGATLDATHNFSDGTFSEMDNTASTYLQLDANISGGTTIANIAFNFEGTPTVGTHYNVSRVSGATGVVAFTNSRGTLGRPGYTYENDPDDGDGDPAPGSADTGGLLHWPALTQTNWQGDESSDWNTAGNWDNGVPNTTNELEAVIGLGIPFNPIIDSGDGSVSITSLRLTDGTLDIDGGTLTVQNDALIGASAGTLRVLDPTGTITVGGNWIIDGANFDPGAGTVALNNSGSAIIENNGRTFYNLILQGSGDAQLRDRFLTIENNLELQANASLVPITNNYEIRVAGDITRDATASFDTNVNGVIILDGTGQAVSGMTFNELEVAGTSDKTFTGTNTVAGDLLIRNGSTLLAGAGGVLDMNDNVTIEPGGVFNGGTESHTFSGQRWRAGTGSYAGGGTIVFDRSANQFINEYIDGNGVPTAGAAEFNHLELATWDVTLENDVNVSGDASILAAGRQLNVQNYQISNTSGTGTFSLGDNARIRVEGSNNYPSGFSAYDMHPASFTFYYGSSDQTILGQPTSSDPAVAYGNLFLDEENIKTMGGDIEIQGELRFHEATLDVSASNYNITIGGRWDQDQSPSLGTFIPRGGTVTFNGNANQEIWLIAGLTPVFNNVVVNKPTATWVRPRRIDMSILGNLNVQAGIFNANDLTVSVGGNFNATGTGEFTSGGGGTYLLNANGGSPVIRTNGSAIPGNMRIEAPGRTYQLQDALTLNGDFTLGTATALETRGNTLNLGNNTNDAASIFGELRLSTTAFPGGTLALGTGAQLSVREGGSIYLVGTASQEATVTRRTTGNYSFTVNGISGNPATIYAQHYRFEYMDENGIFIGEHANIDATHNFSDGAFLNGTNDGTFLRIENTQDLSATGTGPILNVAFPANPGGSASNVSKRDRATGPIEFEAYTGDFAGEDFDSDPNALITWLPPLERVWTGAIDADWYTAGNWEPAIVPASDNDVVIPQGTTNIPVVGNNANAAEANNLLIEAGAFLQINTDGSDPKGAGLADLIIHGDLDLESSSSLEMLGSDDVLEVVGAWNESAGASFSAGTGLVRFTSAAGTNTLSSQNIFYDLEINLSGGATELGRALTVSNDFTVSGGTFRQRSFVLEVGNHFDQQAGTTYEANGGVLRLYPRNGTAKTITSHGAQLFTVNVGESGGSVTATYSLGNNLSTSRSVFVNDNITLDLNGNDLQVGTSDGINDLLDIRGTVEIQGGESLRMSADGAINVLSGGTFSLNGTSSNRAVVTRSSTSGHYTVEVESGGTIDASGYQFSFLQDGVFIRNGATVASTVVSSEEIGLSDGLFSGGSGAQYLRIENDLPASFFAENIIFNSGPTSNVRRKGIADTDPINLRDATGALSGVDFEDDDGAATTGLVRWEYNFELFTWTGATDGSWANAANWDGPTGEHPGQDGTDDRVSIPDVSPNTFPTLNSGGTVNLGEITVLSGASLTIDNTTTVNLNRDASDNGGSVSIASGATLEIADGSTLNVAGNWLNEGTFTPGTSQVTFNTDENINLNGGSSFYNLVINSSSAATVFTTTGSLDVNNNLSITSGTLRVDDPAHTIRVGHDLTVDATNGHIEIGTGTIVLDGTNQTLNVDTEALHHLSLEGSGTKSLGSTLSLGGNLSIAAGVTLDAGAQTVNLSGDFINNGTLSGGTSTFTLNASSPQIVQGSGSTTFNNLTVNNTGAELLDIILRSDITIDGTLNLTEGIVDADNDSELLAFTDNGTVSGASASSFVSGPVQKAFPSASTTTFTYPVGENSVYAAFGIEHPAATGTYTVQYFLQAAPDRFTLDPANPDGADANALPDMEVVSGAEYWDLSRDAGTSTPTITLHWEDNVRSDFYNLSELVVAHYENGNWVDKGRSTTSGTVESSGSITSASAFTFNGPTTFGSTDGSINPLPVELLSFSGEVAGEAVELEWVTAWEKNNDFFVVERSADGKNFIALGEVAGAGDSQVELSYKFTDVQPLQGIAYYRLKQVDYDGKFNYSRLISLTYLREATFVAGVYPNPAERGQTVLSIEGAVRNSTLQLSLVHASGKVVRTLQLQSDESGIVKERITGLDQLASGVYTLLITGERVNEAIRLVLH